MQIHREYTMYGHFFFLKRLLGNVQKWRFFFYQILVCGQPVWRRFMMRFMIVRPMPLYVQIAKDLTLYA